MSGNSLGLGCLLRRPSVVSTASCTCPTAWPSSSCPFCNDRLRSLVSEAVLDPALPSFNFGVPFEREDKLSSSSEPRGSRGMLRLLPFALPARPCLDDLDAPLMVFSCLSLGTATQISSSDVSTFCWMSGLTSCHHVRSLGHDRLLSFANIGPQIASRDVLPAQ